MDTFGYVSVILSVVIGLGLSHLLTGVVDLAKARARVRFYWVHLVWVALTFVGHVFLWWTMWNLRLMRAWDFFTFLLLLMGPVLLFASAGFLVPKVEPDKAIDLRAYFYENRGGFFGTSAAFTALMSLENWLLTGRGSPAPVTATFVLWVVLLGLSAFVKSARYHAAVALLFVALFLAFILMFGLKLGAG